MPYPYAIDKDSNYYLMLEDVVINKKTNEFNNDPYDYYYSDLKKNYQEK